MTQLALPIAPHDFNRVAVSEALAVLPARMDTPEARAMLIAIALQESRLKHRWQVLDSGGKGPARGLLQFEQGTRASRGGVWGVYLHKISSPHLAHLCHARSVAFDPPAIWKALETDDVLAAGLARLLLLTDPCALPLRGEFEASWALYARRTWRPGKPHRSTWDAFYDAAWNTVEGA